MPIARDYSRRSSTPISDSAQRQNSALKTDQQTSSSSRPHSPPHDTYQHTSNRVSTENSPLDGRISPSETRLELIERIKRDQRANWLRLSEEPHNTYADKPSDTTSSLLPPLEITSKNSRGTTSSEHAYPEPAASIERPRSALHRGDFRTEAIEQQGFGPLAQSPRPVSKLPQNNWLGTSPTTPWYAPTLGQLRPPPHDRYSSQSKSNLPQPRTRALSSSSFVYISPTSPLANESTNNDPHDLSRGRTPSPDKHSRRHTFSPYSLQSSRRPHIGGLNNERRLPGLRREGTYPYQAHQPRRSLNSFSDAFPMTQNPTARMRRPSLASDASPLQQAPMIGRYEESILRGRMSSLPSRPLDFVAQIGVLGKGNCKSSLRCPPHVTVPFPAVFYNYGTRPGSPSTSREGPSPYVGMIDLDSFLPSRERPGSGKSNRSCSPSDERVNAISTKMGSPEEMSQRHGKSKRRTATSPKAPPKGSYRIPQQGQIQIIIKNPNKTAVKLFLVPYDLTGMDAGHKTFIRQRSYSAGPIIDMPLSCRSNLGTDRPEAAISTSDNPQDRPVLRYLIHLNICCPSRGRFFLYKSIRVVFANRVPDGKEKLRQEIQLPEPRFSPYKPDRQASTPATSDAPSVARQMDLSILSPQGIENETWQPDPFLHGPQARTMPTNVGHGVVDREGDIPMQSPSPRRPFTLNRDSSLLRPLGSHTFERLSTEAYGSSNSRQRTASPIPAESLLALQLRNAQR